MMTNSVFFICVWMRLKTLRQIIVCYLVAISKVQCGFRSRCSRCRTLSVTCGACGGACSSRSLLRSTAAGSSLFDQKDPSHSGIMHRR